MVVQALRIDKEYFGDITLLGSRESNAPKVINGVSGRYVQLQAECSREDQPAFYVYLTAEDDKKLRLPELEVRISYDTGYFVSVKERINNRETNDDGREQLRRSGYQEVGLFLTGVKIEEVL
ncbi:hypothetical protein G9L25_002523 [Enterococcus faecalis]|uniref:hypothetical protein n=1 Tax=Enterococcus faecalis TaxID=1351 RepID=UPI000F50DA21|nr:hypothetical protein [Enterococcus faecalis]EGO6111573.1 hypothetical protein [Enterococcus faecalis]EGO8897021.1 hypothetical protein [Enterococcus faecalis]ROZ28425.1 hypothetical protein EGX33_05320 [Enterococcus faecalis]